jgi:hypothetical protein
VSLADPLDPETAPHAKPVRQVPVHFPIGLPIAGAAFDGLGRTRRRDPANAAWDGLPAWPFQREGQNLKGLRRGPVPFACTFSAIIGLAWWIGGRAALTGTGTQADLILGDWLSSFAPGVDGQYVIDI